jgi:DNA replication and repair protein RecF
MYLRSLQMVNFRNYVQEEIKPGHNINCITGDNGVGKTNLLDAIYYLSFSKSFLNPVDSQNISFGADFFMLEGAFAKNQQEEHIYCGFKKGKKKILKRNNKEYEKLSDHIGHIPLVIISPADYNLVSGGSDERRKFIDSVISQYNHEYLVSLMKYNRALLQRNSLLKQFAKANRFDQQALEIWDEQLIHFSQMIHAERSSFFEKLLPIFREYYEYISEGTEKVGLEYTSQLSRSPLKELLRANQQKDSVLQYTTSGTHKDDLNFTLSEKSIKKTGSQGQQKTFLIALKFAQFEFIKKIHNFNPLLLLDDIFDKLDKKRVFKIVQLVSGDSFGQIFMTDTNKERIKQIMERTETPFKHFHIEKGQIKPE